MATQLFMLDTQWQLIGSTPLDVETHSHSNVMINVTDQASLDPKAPFHLMGNNGVILRTFDAPGLRVFGKTDDTHGAQVVTIARANVTLAITQLMGQTLTVDPQNGDVFQGGA